MTFTSVDVVGEVVAPPVFKPAITGLVVSVGLWGGLVDHSDADDSGMGHWLNGLTWKPESTERPTVFDPCTYEPPEEPPGQTHAPNGNALPFLVEVRDECSSYGFAGAEYRERATRALLVKEPWSVEAQFERGALTAGSGPFLADVDDDGLLVILGGTPQTPARALALLNQAIADANIGQGVIHASAMLAELWQEAFGLRQDAGGRLLTANGNFVVAGNGYWGASPEGSMDLAGAGTSADHTTEWAYATDLLNLHRGSVKVYPDTMAEATDRSTNTVTYRATRPWAIEWSNLLHAAVKVTV